MGLGRARDEKRRRDLGKEGNGVERLPVERSPTSRGECLRKRRDAYVYVRPGRRRWLRWEDPLRKYAEERHTSAWQELAENSEAGRERWRKEGNNFKDWYIIICNDSCTIKYYLYIKRVTGHFVLNI